MGDALTRGVWGENSKLGNNLNYGGPDCAKECSPWFKILCISILLPYLLYFLRTTTIIKNAEFQRRFEYLQKRGRLSPNMLEIAMGLTTFLCVAFNTVSKY